MPYTHINSVFPGNVVQIRRQLENSHFMRLDTMKNLFRGTVLKHGKIHTTFVETKFPVHDIPKFVLMRVRCDKTDVIKFRYANPYCINAAIVFSHGQIHLLQLEFGTYPIYDGIIGADNYLHDIIVNSYKKIFDEHISPFGPTPRQFKHLFFGTHMDDMAYLRKKMRVSKKYIIKEREGELLMEYSYSQLYEYEICNDDGKITSIETVTENPDGKKIVATFNNGKLTLTLK